MLNIAICDDEAVEIKYLTSLIQQWSDTTKTMVNISSFPSAEAFLFKYEEDKSFDILLLDIQMKAMDGVELAKKIRETNSSVQIVFITGFLGYFSSGFDVAALHYLIKPVTKDKFFEVLSKACENCKKLDSFILVYSENENLRINLKDLFYVEAFGHSCTLHCEETEYEVKLSISEMKALLDDSFIYSHRSYVVNLKHILRLSKTDIYLDNGNIIPVSRRMYNDVNLSFIRYYKGDN